MPRKKKVEELKKDEVEVYFGENDTPIGLIYDCSHQNLAEENGVTYCQVCNQTI